MFKGYFQRQSNASGSNSSNTSNTSNTSNKSYNNLTRMSQDDCYSRADISVDRYVSSELIKKQPDIQDKMVFVGTAGPAFGPLAPAMSTNTREKFQLSTRPYRGHYIGPGTQSNEFIDLETALLQGVGTNLREKACQSSQGSTTARFICLPEFGNPQRVERIIFPGQSQLIGEPSRDNVRRVDYYRRCVKGEYNNHPQVCGEIPRSSKGPLMLPTKLDYVSLH